MLEILYQDEDIIAINKPHGLLVHRSSIARDASEFALQLLRDQISQTVYPAHRLDRKTAGILLFSLNKEMDRELQQLFQNQLVDKRYIAVLRGHAPDEMHIDYPLKKDNGTIQEAQTDFKTIAQAETSDSFW
ncbi:pseudouridine synthase [Sphingobacterium sp. SG20118]|uniref:pseudouridine synthase n=1 Tax=Sphingobacterium sp. SG20118 TaxID=3367156 RepID=UPI0037DFC1FB